MEALGARGHLQRARERIRLAMDQWNPANLDQVEGSRQLLVMAVEDMRVFDQAMRANALLATPELRTAILAVKKDIEGATRVVDACVAFHRGLASRLGADSPGYDQAGYTTGEPAQLEHEVLG